MLEYMRLLLGLDNPLLYEEQLAVQFISSHYRVLQNEHYFSKLRFAEKYRNIIIKDNTESHYSNTCLKSVRKFSINYKRNTLFITWSYKNKIKFGALGELLAQSYKTR